MSNYYGKQPSSRILKAQNLTWTGTGTLVSTTFTAQTYQVRVATQLAGWINIDATGNSSTLPTTLGGAGTPIFASLLGEYFAVTPGEIFSFSSTTTSSGQFITVTEMS
jgi:hypothetical protein